MAYFSMDAYAKGSRAESEATKASLSRVSGWERAARILDLGCGSGVITRWMADTSLARLVVGVDVMPQMVEYAQFHHQRTGLQYIVADVQDTSVVQPDWRDSFDLVTAFNLFHIVPRLDHVLNNALQVMAPGGRIFFNLNLPWKTPVWRRVVLQLEGSERWRNMFKDLSRCTSAWYRSLLTERPLSVFPWLHVTGMRRLLETTGFTVLKLEEVWTERPVKSSWISAILPHTCLIPPEERREFMRDLEDAIFEAVDHVDNPVAKCCCLYVTAAKPMDDEWTKEMDDEWTKL